MRSFKVLRLWWNYPKGAAIADHHRFRRPEAVDIIFFSLFRFCFSVFPFFPFGLVCAAAPASSLYRVVAILI
jgi:hypothetical protein